MSKIRLMRPYISFDEVEMEFREVFESGTFTRGKYAENLRQQLREYTGAKHAFLTTSATTSLWICLKLLGIGKEDEVIVSDFSFPATANVVEDLGARVVFADVDAATFNMMPDELESKITSQTKAVIFVDALGSPEGVSEIKTICERHGLPLIEDAACGMGSEENANRVGSIADLTCFSFHPRKLISSGEGGAIVTNRDDWAEWLEVKLSHGAKGLKGIAFDFVDYGYNFRLPELQAIMVSKQLAKLDQIVESRNLVRKQYIEGLEQFDFVAQKISATTRSNIQSLVFKVPDSHSRDSLIRAMRDKEVEATIGTYALSGTTYYSYQYKTPQRNSIMLEEVTITLPCYDGVDVEYVLNVMRNLI